MIEKLREYKLKMNHDQASVQNVMTAVPPEEVFAADIQNNQGK